jgi:hypothetical protein
MKRTMSGGEAVFTLTKSGAKKWPDNWPPFRCVVRVNTEDGRTLWAWPALGMLEIFDHSKTSVEATSPPLGGDPNEVLFARSQEWRGPIATVGREAGLGNALTSADCDAIAAEFTAAAVKLRELEALSPFPPYKGDRE